MIYVNDILVTDVVDREQAKEIVQMYLKKEKLLLVNEDNIVLSNEECDTVFSVMQEEVKLKAIRTNTLVREFKEELEQYVLKVEEYIGDTREREDYSETLAGFVQLTEAIIQFERVADFLQKDLVDHEKIEEISSKALEQAELGNNEYILDLMEYELLPILQHFYNETNEVV